MALPKTYTLIVEVTPTDETNAELEQLYGTVEVVSSVMERLVTELLVAGDTAPGTITARYLPEVYPMDDETPPWRDQCHHDDDGQLWAERSDDL